MLPTKSSKWHWHTFVNRVSRLPISFKVFFPFYLKKFVYLKKSIKIHSIHSHLYIMEKFLKSYIQCCTNDVIWFTYSTCRDFFSRELGKKDVEVFLKDLVIISRIITNVMKDLCHDLLWIRQCEFVLVYIAFIAILNMICVFSPFYNDRRQSNYNGNTRL